MSEDKVLKIDVAADIVCPWCYLGWQRLVDALKLRPDVKVELNWRPFQLNPSMPEEGIDYQEYSAKRFDPERMKESRARLSTLGSEVGLAFNFDKIEKTGNTNAAHRLILWAQQEGKLAEIVPAVMKAQFTEGRYIGDVGVLADIGASIGMDRDALLKRFAEGTDKDTVSASSEQAREEGISSVPFYTFGSKVTVEGCNPSAVLAGKIDEAFEPLSKAG